CVIPHLDAATLSDRSPVLCHTGDARRGDCRAGREISYHEGVSILNEAIDQSHAAKNSSAEGCSRRFGTKPAGAGMMCSVPGMARMSPGLAFGHDAGASCHTRKALPHIVCSHAARRLYVLPIQARAARCNQ